MPSYEQTLNGRAFRGQKYPEPTATPTLRMWNVKRYITVNHTIEGGNHVVRLYTPNHYEYKIGRWPEDEITSLEAIWAGAFEGFDLCKEFDAEGIAVHSTDEEAFQAYCAETDAE